MFGLRWGIGALFLLFASIVWEWSRPDLTIVGNVTVDLVNGQKSLGGAVSYAAAVAAAFGVRACVVTANAPDVDLSIFREMDVHVVPSNATLTFEHSYTFWGNHRKLRVLAQPNVTLTWQHVPLRCRRAKTFLLGPLMPEDMDPASFLPRGARAHSVALMAQGLQRALDGSKKVVPLKGPSAQLRAALGPHTTVFLSDVEADAWAPGELQDMAAATARVLVTRGPQGADDHTPGAVVRRPSYPTSAVVDTNGAGDCFATAYELARCNLGHPRPSAVANWAGATAVGQPQDCKPECITDALRGDWDAISQLGLSGEPDEPGLRRQGRLHLEKELANLAGRLRSALETALGRVSGGNLSMPTSDRLEKSA